jgi:hypothetical protein
VSFSNCLSIFISLRSDQALISFLASCGPSALRLYATEVASAASSVCDPVALAPHLRFEGAPSSATSAATPMPAHSQRYPSAANKNAHPSFFDDPALSSFSPASFTPRGAQAPQFLPHRMHHQYQYHPYQAGYQSSQFTPQFSSSAFTPDQSNIDIWEENRQNRSAIKTNLDYSYLHQMLGINSWTSSSFASNRLTWTEPVIAMFPFDPRRKLSSCLRCWAPVSANGMPIVSNSYVNGNQPNSHIDAAHTGIRHLGSGYSHPSNRHINQHAGSANLENDKQFFSPPNQPRYFMFQSPTSSSRLESGNGSPQNQGKSVTISSPTSSSQHSEQQLTLKPSEKHFRGPHLQNTGFSYHSPREFRHLQLSALPGPATPPSVRSRARLAAHESMESTGSDSESGSEPPSPMASSVDSTLFSLPDSVQHRGGVVFPTVASGGGAGLLGIVNMTSSAAGAHVTSSHSKSSAPEMPVRHQCFGCS